MSFSTSSRFFSLLFIYESVEKPISQTYVETHEIFMNRERFSVTKNDAIFFKDICDVSDGNNYFFRIFILFLIFDLVNLHILFLRLVHSRNITPPPPSPHSI